MAIFIVSTIKARHYTDSLKDVKLVIHYRATLLLTLSSIVAFFSHSPVILRPVRTSLLYIKMKVKSLVSFCCAHMSV